MNARREAQVLLALGFASLLGQVALLREVLVASFGSELVVLLGLGMWLLGTAGGALIPGRGVRVAMGGLALALLGGLALARLQRVLVPGIPGAFLDLGTQAGLLAAVLLPASLLSGLAFRGAASRYAGGTLRAYALESLGGLAGGFLGTLLPALGAGNALLGGLAAGIALGAALAHRASWRGRMAGAMGALLVTVTVVLLDPVAARMALPGLQGSGDTPYGRVAVVEHAGQRAVFLNGALAWEDQGTSAEELVHPAMLLAERPGRVLVLGGLGEGVAREARRHGALVDCVELDRRLAGPAEVGEGIRLHLGDPRRFVEEGPGPWDVLLCALPEPDSAQANRVYTREFFLACRRRLGPEGLLALRLRLPENRWTPLQLQRTASIHRALKAAFPSVRVLPGAETLLVASPAVLPSGAELVLARWAARGIEARLVSAPYLRHRFLEGRGPALEALLERTPAPPNTDARPVCHPATLLLWLTRFALGLATRGLPEGLGTGGLLVLGLAALLGSLLARGRPRRRAVLLAAIAGLSGMGLESLLLLAFQVRHGILYLGLGLMLTAFMAGMAAGAWWADRKARFAGLAPWALGALGLLLAPVLAHAPGLPGWAAGLLLFAAGGLSGGTLACAARAGLGPGPLYAWDLAGACLGALGVGLVLLPFAGTAATSFTLGLAALCAAWVPGG